ncbi:helix-turn-helix domain-containing protein [Streptomyces sp. NPDC053755]|uniref:helix-turn-helix domain-containing protein n=1 Tax=Streptomyces sp. NPDC053755 TaxID=3155815 RepID=UPI003416B46A
MSPTSRGTADSSPLALPPPKERRRLREALALSEDQLAEAMGVTRATVRSWETGRTEPRGRKREAYMKLLGAYEEEPEPSRAGSAPEPEARGKSAPPARPQAAARRAGKPPKTAGPLSPATAEHEARPERSEPKPAPADPEPRAAHVAPVADPEAAADPEPRAAHVAPVADPEPTADPEPAAQVAPVAAGAEPGAAASGPVVTGHAPAAAAGPEPAGEAPSSPGAPPPASVPAYGADTGTATETDTHSETESAAPRSSLTPEEAFDALYAYAAPGLAHQTYLLTGRRRLSRESVERAFHHAWQHWPEVAVDRDPVGWVRVVAYEYALSPWHRLRRRHRHPDSPPTEAGRRALLTVLLDLPPSYRRTVLLYDGLGLDLPDTAAETEASTPAAANRLLHARTAIGQRIPELADPDALHRRLSALVAEAPTATLPSAKTVRSRSEWRVRLWTRTALSVTTVLVGATAFTAATAPTHYMPTHAPGERVDGVPVSGGSPRLTPRDRQLREILRERPHSGPERLIPDTH